jgi:PAS domain S-box-containing protein
MEDPAARPDEEPVSKRIIAGYVAALAAYACVLLLVPSAGAVGWPLVGLLSAAAVIYGVRRNRPARAAPWWLLAGAVVALSLGDTMFALGGRFAVLSDVTYLAMFPLVAACLVGLTRTSVVLQDRSRLIGALMFMCAVALPVWVLVISPLLHTPSMPPGEKSMIAAYLLGDLLILVTAGRLLLAAPASWSLLLLGVGALGGLAGDLAYAIALFAGSGWVLGGPGKLGYLVMYGAWGAAALHPAMAELSAPMQTRPPRLQGRWLAMIGVSLAMAPALLLGESLSGRVRDGLIIAIVSVLIYILAFTQLADVANAHQQSLLRERGLRRAAGALVAATAPAEVGAAVRVAIGRLMPAGTRYGIHFADDATNPADPGERCTRLTSVADLPAAAQAELAAFTEALVCPLLPRQRGAVRPDGVRPDGVGLDGVGLDSVRPDGAYPQVVPAGTVTVAADRRVLAAAQDAIEVLAVQARLALERIALTEVINRRDSHRYLRTMIENTSDIVLVVGEDDTIRYASPALHRVLGLTLPPSGRLPDLVGADEHARIGETLGRSRDAGVADGVADTWHLHRPDGARVVVDVSCRDLRDDRMVRGYVLTLRDVTSQHVRREEEIRQALRNRPAGQNRQSSANKFR